MKRWETEDRHDFIQILYKPRFESSNLLFKRFGYYLCMYFC